MKWTSRKQQVQKPTPKLGDTRTVIKYAWLPVKTETYWVWRERYAAIQKYKSFEVQEEEITIFGFRQTVTNTHYGWFTERKLALDYYNHHGIKENLTIKVL